MEASLKILHIGKYYYPFHGGMESVVQDLCEGLASANQEVDVICSHTGLVGKKENINNVSVTKLSRLGTLFSQSLNPTMFFRLLFMVKKYDVIHLHYPNPLAEFASLFIPVKTPLIITYHSDVIRQKFLLPFYRPLQKRILQRADKIIVPTKNHITCSDILPEFSHKCEIIPFGLKTGSMPEPDQLEDRVASLKGKYGSFALFVGRLVGYKGLDVLIEASKNISGKVLIVGKGPENERLRNLVKKLGLESKIKILGRVEDLEEFWSYFYASEFFVLPSISSNENFGIVQLEAMYCKKAVIATNLKSGVPLVGEKGVTSLLVAPNDTDQLYKSMELLFQNKDLSIKMGAAGRLRFDNLYTFEKMINSHIRLYKEMTKSERNSQIEAPTKDLKIS